MNFISNIGYGISHAQDKICDLETQAIGKREPSRLLAAKVAAIAFGYLCFYTAALPCMLVAVVVMASAGKSEWAGRKLGEFCTLPLLLVCKVVDASLGIILPSLYFGALPTLFRQARKFLDQNEYDTFTRACNAIFGRGSSRYYYLENYKSDYRTLLLKLEDIFAGRGSRELDENEKIGILKELADAFSHCVPGWGATLQQQVTNFDEPGAPLAKIDHWINCLKREVVDEIARESSVYENRNIANRIMEAIARDIHLDRLVSDFDVYGVAPHDVLRHFYSKFTKERVYDYLLTKLNEDTRAELRQNLQVAMTEIIDENPGIYGMPSPDDDGYFDQFAANFLHATTNSNHEQVFHFTRAAVELLAAKELNLMTGR